MPKPIILTVDDELQVLHAVYAATMAAIIASSKLLQGQRHSTRYANLKPGTRPSPSF
jgi:hypothetical protein